MVHRALCGFWIFGFPPPFFPAVVPTHGLLTTPARAFSLFLPSFPFFFHPFITLVRWVRRDGSGNMGSCWTPHRPRVTRYRRQRIAASVFCGALWKSIRCKIIKRAHGGLLHHSARPRTHNTVTLYSQWLRSIELVAMGACHGLFSVKRCNLSVPPPHRRQR